MGHSPIVDSSSKRVWMAAACTKRIDRFVAQLVDDLIPGVGDRSVPAHKLSQCLRVEPAATVLRPYWHGGCATRLPNAKGGERRWLSWRPPTYAPDGSARRSRPRSPKRSPVSPCAKERRK